MSVRFVLSLLGMAFAVYQVFRGLVWVVPPESPALLVGAVVLYLPLVALAVLATTRRAREDETRKEPMPLWVAVLTLVSAVVLPAMTTLGAPRTDGPPVTYGTWYVGGVGLLMVVVMVRRRAVLAWLGTVVLAVVTMIAMGPLPALSQGLVGSVVWVGVAHMVTFLIDRAERDAAELGELQAMTSAWEAAQEGRERERRIQLQRALAVGGPVLSRVIAMHGVLSDEERRNAGIAEARLRDELRGPRLLDDAVRAAIDIARRRGSQVSVFDEGGLDGLSEAQLTVVRAALAKALDGAASERIIIRTSPHERIVVTVVGRSRVDGDEDAVDLWREIEAPRSAAFT